MDELEKFIQQNKKDLDVYEAGEELWDRIESNIPGKKNRRSLLLLRIAAVLIILFGVAFLVWDRADQDQVAVQTEAGQDGHYSEMDEIRAHYTSLIRVKLELLENDERLTAEDKADFLSILDEMDAEYETLGVELREDLSNERILEAMISNYRQRLELLEQLMERLNNNKKENDVDKVFI